MITAGKTLLVNTLGPIPFWLAGTLTPYNGLVGAGPTVQFSRNGGGFGPGAGTVTDLGAGWYTYTPAASETDTLGVLIISATAAGATDGGCVCQVVSYDPQDSVRLGLTALPAVDVGGAGSLLTSGVGANQIQPTSGNVGLTSTGAALVVNSVIATESYPADGAQGTVAQLLYLLLSLVGQYDVAGTSLVARGLDSATAAATYLLNDATNPTARTRTG